MGWRRRRRSEGGENSSEERKENKEWMIKIVRVVCTLAETHRHTHTNTSITTRSKIWTTSGRCSLRVLIPLPVCSVKLIYRLSAEAQLNCCDARSEFPTKPPESQFNTGHVNFQFPPGLEQVSQRANCRGYFVLLRQPCTSQTKPWLNIWHSKLAVSISVFCIVFGMNHRKQEDRLHASI